MVIFYKNNKLGNYEREFRYTKLIICSSLPIPIKDECWKGLKSRGRNVQERGTLTKFVHLCCKRASEWN